MDRFLFGFWSLFLNSRHIQRAAVIVKPSTLLKLHRLLKARKYRRLYSSSRKGKPGPRGPSPELIQTSVELKRRNPRFGSPRIAQHINRAFGTDIDKDVVRRVLTTYYRPAPGGGRMVQRTESLLSSRFRIVEIEHVAKPFSAMNRIIG